MYAITTAALAKRRLKKLRKSGVFDERKFIECIGYLRQGAVLPVSFQDHQLKGNMASLRECHLGFDLLMVYRRNEILRTITITDIGTHDEIFK